MVAALAQGLVQERLAATLAGPGRARLATGADPITGVSEFPNIDEPPPPVPVDAPDRAALPGCLRGRSGPASDRHLERPRRTDRRCSWPTSGRPAVHTARATFAKNLFEVVGIRAVSERSVGDPRRRRARFSASGARSGVLVLQRRPVRRDGRRTWPGPSKPQGRTRVYLAGRPGDHRAEWEAAGVDEFVYQGCDRLDVLTRALDTAGVA